jgi:hypothetical protein
MLILKTHNNYNNDKAEFKKITFFVATTHTS